MPLKGMYSSICVMFKLFSLLIVTSATSHNIFKRSIHEDTITGEEQNNLLLSAEKCSFDERCFCNFLNKTAGTKIANCSGKKIRSIPLIDSDIVQIDLSHNLISSIPEDIFQNCTYLQWIDLSYNNISVVLNGSFIGLEELQSLKLNRNMLRYKENAFGSNSFRPLINLKHLNIENNVGFYTAGQTYPDFSELTKLETLVLDGVNDKMLGRKLMPLRNLKSFKMSNISGRCDLKEVDHQLFEYTTNLENIEMTGCLLRRIPAGTFSNLSQLTHLNLSFNIFLKFNGVIDAIHDLQNTSIKVLKLNKIHETFHLNTEVPLKLVEPLKNTYLEELEIDSNRIQIVTTGALPNLPKTLVRISAADNSFSSSPYLFEARYLTIRTLNISNLYATHDFDTGKINKREVLSSFTPNTGHEINVHIPIPKYLKKIYINRSTLRFFVPKTTFLENNLELVDFSENLVNPWIGPLLNVGKIKYADFSQNYCSNVSYVFFSNMTNIETLLLNNNLLGFIIPEDKDGRILKGLSKLKVLNLSQNRIGSIPGPFFQSQTSIQYLDLSYNLLSNVTFALKHMHKLQFLDLSFNQIRYLSPNTLQILDHINSNGNLTINLIGNPVICECDSIKFMKWMSLTDVKFGDLNKYECFKSDGSKIYLKHISTIYQKLLKDCSHFSNLIVAMSICLLLFFIIIAAGIIYRYRWKLRYLFYMTKQKYRSYHSLKIDNMDDFLYDAFISYADNDENFVHGEMLEELEKKFGFKLCLHKRDFLPGQDIAENIANAIHKSNKTVVVMSKNFLSSYWCMFEFNMARMESIYSRDGNNILFLILYENIPTKDFPLLMLELIHSETYIEYPTDDLGTEIFWMKIKDALTM